jgi:HD-GYP domain-containing protein (c-di-GMP phosphodiesterase class II)
MQHIRSKDIFYLLRNTLKLFDRRPIVHGGRVAYYVYKMLKQKGGLEDFQLADIVFLTTFHDIGAYRTEDIEQIIRYETKQFEAHSQYGYLFLSHLTLLGEISQAVMYHHTDYTALSKSAFSEKELTSYISLAEAIDIYSGTLGAKFSLDIFKSQLGTRFSPTAYELFVKANSEVDLIEQVRSREYINEVETLMDNFILRNEEKEKLLEFLMFTLALKSGIVIRNTAACVALCEKMANLMKLNVNQHKNLIYAAYVHDIGYMAFRKEWIEEPTKLAAAHLEKLAYHTLLMEQLLKDKMNREVVVIAAAHHERVDGQGYPRRLNEKQMSLPQMILQFCDATVLFMEKPYDGGQVIEMVKRNVDGGSFNNVIAKVFIDRFDEICGYVDSRTEELLAGWREVENRYAALGSGS